MNRRACPRVLLVEGKDEVFVLAELLEASGISWPHGNEPVNIKPLEGVNQVLAPGLIEAELKASGLQALGVVVDADTDAEERWRQVRDRVRHAVSDFPENCMPEGTIHTPPLSPRVGVWIMPDNVANGMLETMLLTLRADEPDLAHHVRDAMDTALGLGAPFRECHRDKSELHTWLAWQDPPGMQMHAGVRARVLKPTTALTTGFVAWCRQLFQL